MWNQRYSTVTCMAMTEDDGRVYGKNNIKREREKVKKSNWISAE